MSVTWDSHKFKHRVLWHLATEDVVLYIKMTTSRMALAIVLFLKTKAEHLSGSTFVILVEMRGVEPLTS